MVWLKKIICNKNWMGPYLLWTHIGTFIFLRFHAKMAKTYNGFKAENKYLEIFETKEFQFN